MTLQAANRGLGDKESAIGTFSNRIHIRNPQSVVRMKLVGAHPAPQMEGMDSPQSKSNYLIGNDQSQWRRNVSSYARARYQNVYPGIDMIYYGNQNNLNMTLSSRLAPIPTRSSLGLLGSG